MQPYKNLSGNSDVKEFELGEDRITVRFKKKSNDGYDTYVYSESSAGTENIKTMKELAIAGLGLNSFINTTVKYRYESRS